MLFKKINKNIIFYSIVSCGCAVLLLLTLNIFTIASKETNNSAAANPPTIILDPGHGGEDGGASSADGIVEKDVNLKIANYLHDMLKLAGFNVTMTRNKDISIHDKSAKSLREKKLSDLKNRLAMINSSPNNVFLSIHQNKFTDTSYFGTQIFYSEKNPMSFDLANNIKTSIMSLLQPDNSRETTLGKDIYLLSQTENPAVIIECGFLSNEAEAAKLNTDEYQKQLAFAIFCGVCAQFS